MHRSGQASQLWGMIDRLVAPPATWGRPEEQVRVRLQASLQLLLLPALLVGALAGPPQARLAVHVLMFSNVVVIAAAYVLTRLGWVRSGAWLTVSILMVVPLCGVALLPWRDFGHVLSSTMWVLLGIMVGALLLDTLQMLAALALGLLGLALLGVLLPGIDATALWCAGGFITVLSGTMMVERQFRAWGSREARRQQDLLVQREVDLRHAYSELLSLSRVKDDFLSAVSHELRTPLTAIKAASAMLADPRVIANEPQRVMLLDVVRRQIERLSRLISDVLDAARAESGGLSYQPALHDLAEIAREAVEACRPAVQAQGIELVLALQPVWSLVDRDRIMQVLINLIGNAQKFTPRGGQITVRCLMLPEAGVLEVEDTGQGIAGDQLEHIFSRFFQGETGQAKGGTGLGLAISRSIVEDGHQGRISVASEPGQGSCFRVWLPLQGARQVEDAVPEAT